jgi:RimJ/RimL family protein N-acetyltransferase
MPDDHIVIREALPEDGPALMDAIGRIDDETEFLGKPGEARRWADGFSERLAFMRERGTGTYVTALAAGEIVGFLGAFGGGFERTRGLIYIAHVGIRRDRRGRGIGTRLFVAIEAWARAHGAWQLELRVDEANERGQALYRKQGFAIAGRIEEAVMLEGRWHAHFWMAKTLRELEGPGFEPIELPPLRSATPAVTIRPLLPPEAGLFCRWERQLLGETPFLLKQPHEVLEEAAMAKIIAEDQAKTDQTRLAALVSSERGPAVIGYASFAKEPGLRMQHDAFFGVHVLRANWACGVGRALLGRLEDSARAHGVRRLVTTVTAHNARGLRFAAAQGFFVQVTSPRFAVIDGRVADRVRLAKVLR